MKSSCVPKSLVGVAAVIVGPSLVWVVWVPGNQENLRKILLVRKFNLQNVLMTIIGIVVTP